MGVFSKGKYSLMISDRSGLAFPYREMVREWTGMWVHMSEYEPKQPQLFPKPRGADPQALEHPRAARTEFATQDFLPNNPFSTAGTTTLTFKFPFGGLEVNDYVRFTEVKEPVGGVSIERLQLQTTTTPSINATQDTIELADVTGFPTSGYIMISSPDTDSTSSTYGVIQNEVIQYTGISTKTLTGCTRGTNVPYRGVTPPNTTAVSHGALATCYGSFKIASRISTTPTYAGTGSVTEYNSFTLTLPSAASTTASGGGFNCVISPLNNFTRI